MAYEGITWGTLGGAIIAALLSWIRNQDVLLAIIHFCCNWIYVVWWCISQLFGLSL